MPIRSDTAGSGENARDTAPPPFGRQTFVRQVETAKADADRAAGKFVLCLVDVDQLRSVNDVYGQAAGDAVLLAVSRLVLNAGRRRGRQPDCLSARFDGDAFMLLLRERSLRDGEEVAEELRRRCAAQVFADDLKITVSVAVAAYRSGESIDALLARIERTLHLAKQFGCDRVEIARTNEPKPRRERTAVTTLAVFAGAQRAPLGS